MRRFALNGVFSRHFPVIFPSFSRGQGRRDGSSGRERESGSRPVVGNKFADFLA